MQKVPLQAISKKTYSYALQEMATRITLVSEQCQTLGNMLVGMDSHYQDFFAIGQKYEGYGLESVSPMEASHYKHLAGR